MYFCHIGFLVYMHCWCFYYSWDCDSSVLFGIELIPLPSLDQTFNHWTTILLWVFINEFYLPREVDVVLKYLKEQSGAKRIGVVGFCWGGVATHYIALQYTEVKAGVSVYGNFL